MTSPVQSRIAPTPSGYLHIGNAFNFLLTEHLTRQQGGLLRLRIDDLDAPRFRAEYLDDIYETLDWLGIAIDAGPRTAAEHLEHFSQQLRIPQYESLLEQLIATGRVFACSCSRKDVTGKSTDGQYPGTCRNKGLPLDMPAVALRYRTDEEDCVSWDDGILGTQQVNLHKNIRDFVVRRKDGLPAYHVVSLWDDEAYGINMVVRGEDLLYSTAAQLWLAKVMAMGTFSSSRFYHHPLLVDAGGGKLSKSTGSSPLKEMRAEGLSAADVRSRVQDWYKGFL
jgi:glutamyl-tRNA synthetase